MSSQVNKVSTIKRRPLNVAFLGLSILLASCSSDSTNPTTQNTITDNVANNAGTTLGTDANLETVAAPNATSAVSPATENLAVTQSVTGPAGNSTPEAGSVPEAITAPESMDTTQSNNTVQSNNTIQSSNTVESESAAETDTLNPLVSADTTSLNDDVLDPIDIASETSGTSVLPGPPAPIDLVGVVYTETELEVFWQKPTGTEGFVYNISVNGEFISTVDAKSFYLNNLEPATTFTIDVQSVDAAGTQGDAATISLTTREASTTINSGNALAILDYVVSITNGDEFADFVDILNKTNGTGWFSEGIERENPSAANSLGLEFSHLELDGEANPDLIYNCVSGGTAQQRSAFGAQSSSRGISFDDCRSFLSNEQSLSGDVDSNWGLIKLVSNPGSSGDNQFRALTITDDNGRQTSLTGALLKYPRTVSNHQWRGSSFEPFNYTKQAFEGQTSITNLSVQRIQGQPLELMFDVQAPETGNKPIQVEGSIESSCATGEISITGTDGSSMTLNADNGNLATFDLTINSNNMIVTVETDWNETNTFKHLLSNADLILERVSCS